eukprot:4138456-Prymnesium_polylepis.1
MRHARAYMHALNALFTKQPTSSAVPIMVYNSWMHLLSIVAQAGCICDVASFALGMPIDALR